MTAALGVFPNPFLTLVTLTGPTAFRALERQPQRQKWGAQWTSN